MVRVDMEFIKLLAGYAETSRRCRTGMFEDFEVELGGQGGESKRPRNRSCKQSC